MIEYEINNWTDATRIRLEGVNMLWLSALETLLENINDIDPVWLENLIKTKTEKK